MVDIDISLLATFSSAGSDHEGGGCELVGETIAGQAKQTLKQWAPTLKSGGPFFAHWIELGVFCLKPLAFDDFNEKDVSERTLFTVGSKCWIGTRPRKSTGS